MPNRFVAPKRLDTLDDVRKALQRIQEQLDANDPQARAALVTTDVTLRAGETVRISPRQGEVVYAKLPKAQADNFGATITIILERPAGTLRLSAQAPDTVNGVRATNFTTATRIVVQSNGLDQWVSTNALPSTSPGGSALDAQYILGAAHASLPNGAVATDSTEVDVTVTPGGTATWALRDGSVALARLEDIPDKRALGNDSGADGPPTPVTVHQELDWIADGDSTWPFDGVDDRVRIGDFNDIERTDARTITAWVTTPSVGAQQALFSKQEAGPGFRGWEVGIEATGKLYWLLASNFGGVNYINVQTNAAAFPAGALAHLAIVYDGSGNATGVTMYVNGVLVASAALGGTPASVTATTVNAQALVIGRRDTLGNIPFAGTIQHAAIFGAALTGAQILEVYNSGTPPDLNALPTVADPLFWLKFDSVDVVGANGINDYGTGAHDGTAEGGLAPVGRTGSLPVRGTAVWQLIATATSGLPLCANGPGAIPSYRIVPQTATGALTGDITKASGSDATAITAGVIVDADVNAAAAIALTKTGAMTGDVTKASGSAASVIANSAVTLAKMATLAAGTVIGRQIDAGTGAPVALVGTELAENIRWGNVTTEAAGGTFTNHALDMLTDTWLFTATSTITGVAGGTSGKFLRIYNGAAAGSGITVTINQFDGASSAGNRFLNRDAAVIVLGPGDSATYYYESSRWRCYSVTGAACISDADKGDITVSASGRTWTVDDGVVTPAKLAVSASNLAVRFSVRVAFTASGVTGTDIDVTVWSAAAPFALRIEAATLRVSTAAGTACALRTASAGGGSVVLPDATVGTQTFTTATTGAKADNAVATATVAAAGSLFLRIDRAVAGELLLECVRT